MACVIWRLAKLETQESPGSVPFQSPAGLRPRRANGAYQDLSHSAGEFPLLQRGLSFCSVQAYNWLDDAHPHYGGSLFCSKFTNLNINLMKKHSPSWHLKLTSQWGSEFTYWLSGFDSQDVSFFLGFQIGLK